MKTILKKLFLNLHDKIINHLNIFFLLH